MIVPLRKSIARSPAGYAEMRRVIDEHLGDEMSPSDLASSAAAIVEAIAASNVEDLRISLTVHEDTIDVEIRGVGSRVSREATPREGSFASWLRGRMHQRGLSHEGTARLVGVSVKTVSRWARSETEPRMRDLRRLHDAFGELPPMHTPGAESHSG